MNPPSDPPTLELSPESPTEPLGKPKPFWNRPLSRRNLFRLGLGGGSAAMLMGASGWYDMTCVEPGWLELVHVPVKLPGRQFARPLRLLHLSDLHYSLTVPLKLIHQAIDMGLAAKPDLVCVTGDFITHGFIETKKYTKALNRLPAALPTFAVLGNHDGGGWAGPYGGYRDTSRVRKLLADAEIPLLHNTQRELTIAGSTIRLAGVGDIWANECDGEAALGNAPLAYDSTIPTILMSHNPDSKDDLQPFAWDLMLCGHTHGGQLHIPLIGAPFAPVVDKRYVAGLNKYDNRLIYTTRGVGNLHGLRLNCRPEVTLLELHSA